MKESAIDQHLIDRVAEVGGEVRKVKWIGRNGAPDRKVLHPVLKCYVETKAPLGALRGNQAREIERMRSLGETVHVFHLKEQIDIWIDGYLRQA